MSSPGKSFAGGARAVGARTSALGNRGNDCYRLRAFRRPHNLHATECECVYVFTSTTTARPGSLFNQSLSLPQVYTSRHTHTHTHNPRARANGNAHPGEATKCVLSLSLFRCSSTPRSDEKEGDTGLLPRRTDLHFFYRYVYALTSDTGW